MKNAIRKIFSVLVAACLCTSMVPAVAMGAPEDQDFINSQDPGKIGLNTQNGGQGAGDTDRFTSPGAGNGATASAITRVFGIVQDQSFVFSAQSPDQNFASPQEAIANTAEGADPGPLFGTFMGSESTYEYMWTLEDVNIAADGSYEYTPHTSSNPSFVGLDGATYPFGTYVRAVFGDKDNGVTFKHSITASDGIEAYKIYRYTISVKDPSLPSRDPATAQILVSTFDNYQNQKLYVDENDQNPTSIEGFIYKDANLVNPVAPLLSSGTVPETSPVYALMMDHAVTATPSQVITAPQSLAITNIDNMPAGTDPYKLPLNVHLAIPADLPNALEVGDTVTVYRYDQATGTVQDMTGTVVQQTDSRGNNVYDDAGNPVLSVQFSLSGTTAALGTFALGYENEDGSFTVESTDSNGGTISPAETRTYPVGSSPKFVMNAQSGYILDDVVIDCDGSPVGLIARTLSGNTFTLDADAYGMMDGETWTITPSFIKAEPDADAYAVSASLSGEGGGTMTVISGAAGATPYTVNMNSSIPAAGEEVIMMPSRDGVYLEFNPGSGFGVKSLIINQEEYAVTGTSYFLSVLMENTTIQVVYEKGLPLPTVTRTLTYNVEGGHGAVSGSDGTPQTSGTLTVNQGSSATVTLLPDTDYMVDKAILKTAGSTEDGIDVADQVTQSQGKANLQIRNIMEDMELTVSFKLADCKVFISVDGDGGTVSPDGMVQLSENKAQRVVITPNAGNGTDSLGYVLGSVTINGVPLTTDNYLTSRNGGKSYTFTIVRSDVQSPDYGVNGDGTTDKVLYINDATSQIKVTFDPKTPEAPAYLNIVTSVDAANGGGSITPSMRVASGEKAEIWLFPDEGKRVKDLTMDGRSVKSALTEDGALYTLDPVLTDHEFVVSFEDGDSALTGKTQRTIRASSGSGGSVTPAGEVRVYDGKDQTFNFFPSTGYEFSSVQLDGVQVYDKDSLDEQNGKSASSFTLKSITADHNLVVTFAKSATSGTERDTYNVDVSVGQNGTASPTGVVEVARGANLPITIIPDVGYSVDRINVMSKTVADAGGTGVNLVDGYQNGVYTQFDVQDDLVIQVSFKEGEDPDQPSTDLNNMVILGTRNVEVAPGLVLEPQIDGLKFFKEAGTEHANVNQDVTIRVTAGYLLDAVTLNGTSLKPVQVSDGVYRITLPKEEITSRMLLQVTSKEQPPSTQVVELRSITVQWTGNGTVSPSGITKGVVRVEAGQSQTFSFIPDAGNRVDSVLVDGAPVTLNNFTYTIPNVTQDMRIQATFVEDPNAPAPPTTAEVSVSGDMTNGFASVGTGVSAAKVVVGSPLTISFKPNSGYETHLYEGTSDAGTEITDQLRNGTLRIDSVPASGKQYFVKFVQLTQAVQYQMVTASSGANGKVSPEGNITVPSGSDMTFTFLGDATYTVDKVWVTRGSEPGVEVSADVDPVTMTYTVTNIDSKVDVWASFKKGTPSGGEISTRTITATAGEGGMVSPSSVTVATGETALFTFMPQRGYKLQKVVSNKKGDVTASVGADGKYEFPANDNEALTATFVPDMTSNPEATKYNVFLSAGEGGMISPDGVVSVPHGGSVGFSIFPNDGYKIDTIEIDNEAPKPFSSSTYALFDVTSERHVKVNFAPVQPGDVVENPTRYTIKATSSMEGAISPSGNITVAEGGMALFSFEPNDGYRLSYLVVDGKNKPATDVVSGQYAFTGVTADHTIHAVFCPADEGPADFVTVNTGNPAGGSIAPSGANLVMKGSNPQYTVSAFYGYTLADIRVNGTSIFEDGPDGTKDIVPVNTTRVTWSNSTLTLKNVQMDTDVVVTFRQKTTTPEQPVVQYSRINVSGGGDGSGGSISYPNGTTVIEALQDDQKLDVSIIPDDGWAIGSIRVDAADGNDINYSWFKDGDSESDKAALRDIWTRGYITLSAAQVNYEVSITVIFRLQTEEEHTVTPAPTRTITAQSFGRGSISPNGAVKVSQNASVTFSMVPMDGYELSGLSIDGKDALGMLKDNRNYTFAPGAKDQKIEATFSQMATPDAGVSYVVKTAIDGRDGASGNASVDEMKVLAGGSATLYFWPNEGSKLVSLSVVSRDDDGNVVENLDFAYNVPNYTLASVTSDVTVTAHFEKLGPDEKPQWTVDPVEITASVPSGGGSVSPTKASVPEGHQQVFSLFPDDGNEVSFLMVNGDVVYVDGGIRSYALIADPAKPNTLEVYYKNVSAEAGDVTVTAKVAVKVMTDGSFSSANATIWPKERTVPAGTPVTFYVKPDPGYTIERVEVDGQPVAFEGIEGTPEEYTNGWPLDARFQRVSGEELAAAQSGLYAGGATVAPAVYQGGAGLMTVAEGDTFYDLYRVTISAANKDITANVIMREISEQHFTYVTSESHELEITAEGGGSVSPLGKGFLPQGASENISIRRLTNYYVESVIATYADGTTKDLTLDVVGNNLRITMGNQAMKVHFKFTHVNDLPPVHFELGSAKDPFGAAVNVNVQPPFSVDGTPTDFPRDVNGTLGGSLVGFVTDETGPNGGKWVLDKVYLNGELIPLTFINSQYIKLPTGTGGTVDVVFRELDPSLEPVVPNMFTITGQVTSGEGTVGGPVIVEAGGPGTITFQPAEGWMLDTENCFDVYVGDDGKEVVRKIPAEELEHSRYTIKAVDRNHTVRVAFVSYASLTVGWTNGDKGYVTPNTMNGEPLRVEVGQSVPFIVAPYEGYDVEKVEENSQNVTGKLRQSAATSQELLAMPGHEGFTVKHTQEGMGVTGPVPADAQTQSLEAIVQASNAANGVVYAAGPDENSSAAPALQNFNYAYGAATAPIRSNTEVWATWTEESNVPKPNPETDLRHIPVEIVGGVGGTADPMEGTGYDGEYVTFNFIPDDGWAVRYLEVSIGGEVHRYESDSAGGKEEYTYGPINGDGYIKVGFDSISHPGSNDGLTRYLRTLRALAQTGDLTAPVMGTLIGIAVLAVIMAAVTYRRRRKTPSHSA